MPEYHEPSTEELEDHFFGSGAFSYGWFGINSDKTNYYDGYHFPAFVDHFDLDYNPRKLIETKEITKDQFIDGIKKYATYHASKTFQDLIEDMDANDVDNVIQLIYFDEIRYA